MLSQSFIHLPGISHTSERRIWEKASSWDAFLEAKTLPRMSPKRKGYFDRILQEAKQAVQQENVQFINNLFPRQEHWRLFDWLKEDALYLDIETSNYYGNITAISIYDGYDTKTLVRGRNLQKDLLQNIFAQGKILVTFNGSSFDLPVINRYFGGVIPPLPHIDLRHVCAKIGLVGGLKIIEKQLDIKRSEDTLFIDGEDAISLWDQYQATGNEKYLELLVKYNQEDTINLEPLAKYAIPTLWKQVRNE